MSLSAEENEVWTTITELLADTDRTKLLQSFEKNQMKLKSFVDLYIDKRQAKYLSLKAVDIPNKEVQQDISIANLFYRILLVVPQIQQLSISNKDITSTNNKPIFNNQSFFPLDIKYIIDVFLLVGDNNQSSIDTFMNVLKKYQSVSVKNNIRECLLSKGNAIKELYQQSVNLYTSCFHIQSTTSSSSLNKKFKPIELPSSSSSTFKSTSMTKKQPTTIQLKTKHIMNQDRLIQHQFQQVLSMETVKELVYSSCKHAMFLQTCFESLSVEFVVEILLVRDGSGLSEAGVSWVNTLRLLYEKINPILLALFRTWCVENNISFDDDDDDDDVRYRVSEIKHLFTVSAQRLLRAFHTLLDIILKANNSINNDSNNSNMINSNSNSSRINNNNNNNNTSSSSIVSLFHSCDDSTSAVSWIEFIASLLSETNDMHALAIHLSHNNNSSSNNSSSSNNNGNNNSISSSSYNNTSSYKSNNTSTYSNNNTNDDDYHECEEDKYVESMLGALVADTARLYANDWKQFVQYVCHSDNNDYTTTSACTTTTSNSSSNTKGTAGGISSNSSSSSNSNYNNSNNSSSNKNGQQQQQQQLAATEDVTAEMEYLLSATRAPCGLFYQSSSRMQTINSNDSNNINTTTTTSSSNNNNNNNNNSSSSVMSDISTSVSEIKMIFPDYGDLFIQACLHSFDFNIERTIDALLSDNLPPQLLQMDRTIHKIWQGKGGGSSSTGGSGVAVMSGTQGKSNQPVYELEENKIFKEKMKLKIMAEKQQWEKDLLLIQREYDDDYDDQYDDAIVYQPTRLIATTTTTNTTTTTTTNHHHNGHYNSSNNNGNAILTTGELPDETDATDIDKEDYQNDNDDDDDDEYGVDASSSSSLSAVMNINKKNLNMKSSSSSSSSSSLDWQSQMKDMKRLNQITMEDEAELKYWKEMRNPNHMSATPPVQQQQQPQQQLQQQQQQRKSHNQQQQQQGQRPPGKSNNNNNNNSGTSGSSGSGNSKNNNGGTNRSQSSSSSSQLQQQQGGGRGGKASSSSSSSSVEVAKELDASLSDSSSSSHQDGKEGGGQGGGGSNNKPYRTKQFDKHHQKDKAMRKFGAM